MSNLGFGPAGQRQYFVEGAKVGLQGGAYEVIADGPTGSLKQITAQGTNVYAVGDQTHPTTDRNDYRNQPGRQLRSHSPAKAINRPYQPIPQPVAPSPRHSCGHGFKPTEHPRLWLACGLERCAAEP